MSPDALEAAANSRSESFELRPADQATAEALPLLSGLPRQQLDRLLQFASMQRYPRGTALFEEGDYADKLHVVVSGTVEIFSVCRGREWGLFLMNSGDILMPVAVLYSEPYLSSARTVSSSRMLLLDAERVRQEATASAQFCLRLGRSVAARGLPVGH